MSMITTFKKSKPSIPIERMIFAKNVKLARIAMDLTQQEFAKQAGYSQSFISDIELAKTAISIDYMADIALFFQVSVIDLLDPNFYVTQQSIKKT